MMNNLPVHLIEKAKAEVREDENRLEQSLIQFKEFISKHPWIKRFNSDDVHLLSFLRAKKYQMDRVFDSFEKMLIFIRQHDNWFDFRGENLQRALDLYKTGFLRVMKGHDKEGRRTVLMNENIDMDRFNPDDVFRLYCLVLSLLSYEVETQISGVNSVCDFSGGFTLRHLTFLPFKSLFEFLSPIKSIALRYKNICFVGIPTFASQFIQVIKRGLSDTMLNRLHILNDVSDLRHFIDENHLTEKYGGKTIEKEAEEEFLQIIMARVELLNEFKDFEIDLTKALAMKNIHETVGSFRKLEID